MIRFCPQLLQAFPNARFIWCVRRGIENILSRQRKFPEVPFRACCQSWTDSVEQWIAVRDQLQGRYVEAHQHEIAIQPEKVAREIAEVLDFSKRQRRGIEDVFTHKRSEQSRFAAEHRWIGLDETPWSSEEQEVFRQICGPAMEAMSYPLEGRTLTAAGPIRLFYPVVEASVRRENVPAEDWGFCRVGERGLQLHPNGPGESPAGVRYLDVPLSGHGKIRATLEVARESVAPVIFGLRIVRVGGSEALAELECEVKPGKEHHWEAEFPPVTGSSEVVISTRMAEGAPTNHGAAAIWSDARLEPV